MKPLFLLTVFLSSCILAGAQNNNKISLLRSKGSTDYVWVAAHRADYVFAPENSIQALENAIYFGADLIETDVRLTKDGHVIMMHDYTVDRMTNGTGRVSNLTLEEIKALRLKNNWGGATDYQVPTLEEFIQVAKGKVCLYLDKAGYDLPGHEEGHLVKELLKILKKHDVLEESVFVLNWPYEKAKRIFGEDLEKVIYCPVIEDKIPDLETYVNEYIEKLSPVAFQFRFDSLKTRTYQLLPKVLASGSKAFVAATWDTHTANHSDRVSIFKRPSEGWGWLIAQGFSILETNYARDLIRYLKAENRH
ncbi:MAG: glycerophosphodiester phosphodiesterase family protein [Bacteroides sp]|nr:glycerophosphodiester phosphodiesterase family protein [Bacteroides sp.]